MWPGLKIVETSFLGRYTISLLTVCLLLPHKLFPHSCLHMTVMTRGQRTQVTVIVTTAHSFTFPKG